MRIYKLKFEKLLSPAFVGLVFICIFVFIMVSYQRYINLFIDMEPANDMRATFANIVVSLLISAMTTLVSFVTIFLIFMTFLEQKKANRILQKANESILEQEQFKHLVNEINNLEKRDLNTEINDFTSQLVNFGSYDYKYDEIIGKLDYSVNEFVVNLKLVELYKGENIQLLKTKISSIYNLKHRSRFNDILKKIHFNNQLMSLFEEYDKHYRKSISNITCNITYLEEKLFSAPLV